MWHSIANKNKVATIAYTIKYSRRKTTVVRISADGVEVRAPYGVSQARIDAFVTSKQDQIRQRLAEFKKIAHAQKQFVLHYDDQVLYRGQRLPLVVSADDKIGCDEHCFYVPPHLIAADLQAACRQIYRQQAQQVLSKRVAVYAQRMQVQPQRVRVSQAKTN